MELQRFNAGKGRDLLEWIISLDDPESLDYPHRKTVTLDQIIREAKACFSLEFPELDETPPHPFVPYSGSPVRCASASRTDPNTVCWKTPNHPDHNV